MWLFIPFRKEVAAWGCLWVFLLRLLQQTQFSHPSLVKRKTCEWQRESVCYKGELFPTVADQGHVDRLSRELSGP